MRPGRCPPAGRDPVFETRLRADAGGAGFGRLRPAPDRAALRRRPDPGLAADLAADLAVALAVELCSWRLDLAADLARAGLDDLTRPLDWLTRAATRFTPAAAATADCPLALHRAGESAVLPRRVWRAQLATFFPTLEEARLALIDRHRPRLRIDDHLRALGATSIEEIELGALCHQLHRALDRREAARLETLARLRNRLAHRQPGAPEACLSLLAGST